MRREGELKISNPKKKKKTSHSQKKQKKKKISAKWGAEESGGLGEIRKCNQTNFPQNVRGDNCFTGRAVKKRETKKKLLGGGRRRKRTGTKGKKGEGGELDDHKTKLTGFLESGDGVRDGKRRNGTFQGFRQLRNRSGVSGREKSFTECIVTEHGTKRKTGEPPGRTGSATRKKPAKKKKTSEGKDWGKVKTSIGV